MKLEKYNKIINNTPLETKAEIRFGMDVLERIHELLLLKFGGKQKLLADKMGKSEAEISRLLSGIQNYTLKTIFKFEVAFGEPIIAVCTQNLNDSTFVLVNLTPNIKHTIIEVNNNGEMNVIVIPYKKLIPSRKIKTVKNKNLAL